jgi:hypothetical protein
VTVSSVSSWTSNRCQTGNKAVDGVIRGYPEEPCAEWASERELVGAWLRIDFSVPRTVERVVLYDRPNLDDQVLAAELRLSTGATVPVGDLRNDGQVGRSVVVAAAAVEWLEFRVTQAKGQNIGLAEIQVFGR